MILYTLNGIMWVICILESFVLLYRSRIGKMHTIIPRLIQPIHQLISVKSAHDFLIIIAKNGQV